MNIKNSWFVGSAMKIAETGVHFWKCDWKF